MNIYALAALFNAFTSGILTTLVLSRARREPGARGFAIFSLTAAAWSAGYVIWQLSMDTSTALLWVRLLMVPAILIPCGFLHFVAAQVGPPHRRQVLLAYAVGAVFIALDATPLFVQSVVPKLGFPFWPVPGPLFAPFLVLWFGLFAYATVLLARGLHARSTLERGPLVAVLVGVVVGLLGGATNFLLWYNIPVPPIGNVLVSVYVFATAFAIARQHLFNVRVISVQLLVFTLWSLLLGRILLAGLYRGPALDWTILGVVIVIGVVLIHQVLHTIEQQIEVERLLAARKEFLDVAAHQLRSPVTDVIDAASILVEDTAHPLAKPQAKLARGIFDRSRQLAALINDYLDATAMDTGNAPYDLGKLQTVDLAEFVRRIADDLRSKARRKGLTLTAELPVQPVFVSSAPDRLEQAIRNLIDNAIRYTERGGVSVGLTTDRGEAQLRVRDTGIGIPADFLPKLFQKFARAPNARELHHDGSGLGLFIVKRIIEAHSGGVLSVESKPGQGTTFSVRLPVVSAGSGQTSPVANAATTA